MKNILGKFRLHYFLQQRHYVLIYIFFWKKLHALNSLRAKKEVFNERGRARITFVVNLNHVMSKNSSPVALNTTLHRDTRFIYPLKTALFTLKKRLNIAISNIIAPQVYIFLSIKSVIYLHH